MKEKYTIIRNESTKLKDLDPEILSLYDQTALAITKAEQEVEEEKQKTQDELIRTLYETVLALLEERKISKANLVCPHCSYTGPVDESGNCPQCGFRMVEGKKDNINLDQLTKSLQSQGFDGRFKKSRRRVLS